MGVHSYLGCVHDDKVPPPPPVPGLRLGERAAQRPRSPVGAKARRRRRRLDHETFPRARILSRSGAGAAVPGCLPARHGRPPALPRAVWRGRRRPPSPAPCPRLPRPHEPSGAFLLRSCARARRRLRRADAARTPWGACGRRSESRRSRAPSARAPLSTGARDRLFPSPGGRRRAGARRAGHDGIPDGLQGQCRLTRWPSCSGTSTAHGLIRDPGVT